jgi:pimeloyl-ACP methyl ester carboxylesterase
MATEKSLATGDAPAVPQTEGFAPFKHAFFSAAKGDPAEIKTWYRIYGNLEPGKSRPLFILHGGPGVNSPTLSPALENFALPKLLPANRPLVLYDQIGCGRTTHLDNRKGDKNFWVPELFIAELDNLTKHLGVRDAEPGFDVHGHSWGAQVSSRYAVWVSTQPVETAPRLHRVVLSSPTCRWKDMWRSRDIGLAELPEKMQEDVKKGIAEGKTDSPEYMAALMLFLSNVLMRDAPSEYQERIKMIVQQLKDNVPYQVIFGTDPLNPCGTLNGSSASYVPGCELEGCLFLLTDALTL